MIDWDSELSTIQMQGVTMAKIGNKVFIRCDTFETAEIIRKDIKENGIVLTVKGNDPKRIAPSNINWDNIVILPKEASL